MNNPILSKTIKDNWKPIAILFLILCATIIYVVAKPNSSNKPIVPDPAFAAFVSGYTGGVISRNHVIAIKLAEPPLKHVLNGAEVREDILSFSPNIEGKLYWKDQRTLEFKPAKPMKSGEVYTATLQLNKVIKIEDKKFNNFVFGFQVIPQSFEVQQVGLRATGTEGLNTYSFEGKVITADEADKKSIEKMLKAKYDGNDMPITWSHQNKNTHSFFIKNLKRGDKEKSLSLSWSGNEIKVDKKGSFDIPIPAKGVFKLLNAFVEDINNAPAHLFFSDPLDERQQFDGLVGIDSLQNINFSVKGNELVVFPATKLTGTHKVLVNQGIKNIQQSVIKTDTSFDLNFKDFNPAVRFVGSGNILASTEGLILPIEAVNLKTIQIRVIQIYQDRVGQFLQFNDLDGSNQLNRVGRPILQKVIRLDDKGVADLGKWNRFTLELSKLIATQPGAIYQIAIGFNKNDIVNTCSGLEADDGLKKTDDPREQQDLSDFDGGSDYFSDGFGQYYDDDYDWRQRDNPCNSAYYSGDRNVIKKNILATDIGMIGKRGTDNSLMVIATNLITAKPMSGVRISIYNYQLQKIATSATDNKGIVQFNLPEKAFFAEAENEGQHNYLKLTDGAALSVSQFDVSGDLVQQGIKGYLYGERGVWRPGDSIYLSFMLEDKNSKLPKSHPIVFELSNPQGLLVHKMVKTSNADGLYSFATATSADAITGNWKAEVKVGGATFSKTIKVETIKPNRLKVNLTFENDKITPEKQDGAVQVSWLTGATAGNLRADFEMILSKSKTKFKGYENYEFDDPNNDFETIDRTIFDGNLDAQGHAVIHPAIQLSTTTPGTLNAYFKGKIYEPGGDFSVSYQTVPYLPYQSYIGIKVPKGSGYGDMLELGKNYTIDVATLSNDGKPVNMDDLDVAVYKTQWRWWWEESESSNADFVNSKYYKEVMSKTISTKNGKGNFALQISGSEWGRYYIRVANKKTGYTTGSFVYFEWPENQGSTLAGMPGGATRLTFTSDKQVYKVGEKMKLYIPGSDQGNILISVENGSKVLQTYWMVMKKGNNEYTIPITAEMTPNIYVNVSEIQPHGQTINDLPIRQYGIIGVKVEDPTTVLEPQIQMASQLRPNEKVNIKVKEKTGKVMTYTVAVVDEGLLDLTNFKTPNPWNVFYAKEALGVKTWDVFDQVIGAYGAKLERLLSIGGDAAISEQPQAQSLRFKPVVKFFGPFTLAKGKTATHSFIMPNYVGSVRTMVVACNDGAYGSAEQATPVKQPLMILSTLPRVAGPSEEISLPVNIFAMENGVRDVTISVRTDKHFSVIGGATRQFHFDKPGNGLVEFNLKVNELMGAGKVFVEAVSGKYKSTNEIDLTVRNPNTAQTKIITKVIQPNEIWTPPINYFGIKGTNAAQLEVSAMPLLNLGKRMNDLLDYPHGCVEQRTSIAFPQLYLNQLVALSTEQKSTIDQHIKDAIRSFTNYQHTSGGFVYWPGSNYTDDWATSYVGHFLLEARKKGYAVMDDMLDKWINFQTSRANSWKPQKYFQDDLIQAYRLYTLALAQKPDWSAMNRMNGLQEMSLQARWRLADAYMVAGRADVAQSLIAKANTTIPGYRSLSYTYGSTTRDEAMILQTLADLQDYNEGFRIAKNISQTLNTNNWMSTQETSFSLIALAQFYQHQQQVKEINYSYQLNNGAKITQSTKHPESQVKLPKNDNNAILSFKNISTGTLYANLAITGTPATGNEIEEQSHLNMQVKYLTPSGKNIDPSHLKQGTDFIAEITIHNPGTQGDYKNMALSQIFPSGWEIRNTRFEGTSAVYERSVPDYQDIRDDRVYTYFDLPAGAAKTFRILLSATYAGKFYQPAVQCSAMYDHSIIAVKPGKWVEVSKR